MKITHAHPRAGSPWCKDQTPIGNGDTEADVLDDIRSTTLSEDPAGSVLVIKTHQDAEEFQEELEKGEFDPSRVIWLSLDPVEKHIHIPPSPDRQYVLRRASDGKTFMTDVPAKPAGTKKVMAERYVHVGNSQMVRLISKKVRETEALMLVIYEPDVEGGDLDCLPQLQAACPDLHVVIFHRVSEKCGVVVEGGEEGDPRELFETQSTFVNEPDLPWVITLIAHIGESTWFAALPKQMKTWVMMCVAKALLTGEPLFGNPRFTVPHKAEKVIYLIPEAGRGSVKKRLTLLGLVDCLYDPIANPDGGLFVRTLSAGEKIKLTDPALLELAKGADIFIDTAVRYLEGDENSVKDVKVLTENILNLLSVGARSLWVAHHAAKGFENATTMTLQNMFRGSGEFGAALTNAYGLCQTEEKTSTLHFHPIVGRDLDDLIPDMILQGRPYLSTISNFRVVDVNAEKFSGAKPTGRPEDSEKQQKIDFAKSVDGSLQDKADAVNARFGSEHSKSTISGWLKEFDSDQR